MHSTGVPWVRKCAPLPLPRSAHSAHCNDAGRNKSENISGKIRYNQMYPASVLATRPNCQSDDLKGSNTQNSGQSVFSLKIAEESSLYLAGSTPPAPVFSVTFWWSSHGLDCTQGVLPRSSADRQARRGAIPVSNIVAVGSVSVYLPSLLCALLLLFHAPLNSRVCLHVTNKHQ